MLSPFIHRELLENNHVHVNGSAISKETGFVYKYKELASNSLRAMVVDAIENDIFPDILPEKGGADAEGDDGERKEEEESKRT